jgi:hypothetical protein
MLGGRAGQALKQSNPAAYYAKYVAPQLDRPGMAGAAANVERQRLLKTITNQAVNPGLDIRSSPGTSVVAMPQGVPVYGKVQAAPAPQQSAPASPATAPSGPSARELQITKEAEAYRKATEEKLALADQTIAKLSDAQEQQRLAAELQNRLAIQAQTSQARGAAQASLKIAPASQTAQTAGTQAFKRRRDQMRLAPIQTTAGINAPASSVLNV